jgi:hypothetical protein
MPEQRRDSTSISIFLDSVWYCRLLCPHKTIDGKELDCDATNDDSNQLPRKLSLRELELLIAIQLLVIQCSGMKISMLKVAGSQNLKALKLKENVVPEPCLNSFGYAKDSILNGLLTNDCDLYYVQHCAKYFHGHKALAKLFDTRLTASKLRNAPFNSQPGPDAVFIKDLGRFVFQEFYLWSKFFNQGITIASMAFQAIKSQTPFHLLVTLYPTWEDLANSLDVCYGTIGSAKKGTQYEVRKMLNPYINPKITPVTKEQLKLDISQSISLLLPQPRVLVSNAKRQRNEPFIAVAEGQDWYKPLYGRQQEIILYSSALVKILARLVRNNKLLFGGTTGSALALYERQRNISSKNHFVLMYLKHGSRGKLKAMETTLKDICVMSASAYEREGEYRIRPISCVSGGDKTTTLSCQILSIAQTFPSIFRKNTLLIYKPATSRLGFIRASNAELKSLGMLYNELESIFNTNKRPIVDILENIYNLKTCRIKVNAITWSNCFGNLNDLAIKLLGDCIPSVDDAATFHKTKRMKKSYTNSKRPNFISVIGAASQSDECCYLTFKVSETNTIQLKIVE